MAEPKHNCGFCCKDQYQVETLIAGPLVMICDECVDLCAAIVAEYRNKSARTFADTIGWVWPFPILGPAA